jgi:hypothetical protein
MLGFLLAMALHHGFRPRHKRRPPSLLIELAFHDGNQLCRPRMLKVTADGSGPYRTTMPAQLFNLLFDSRRFSDCIQCQ